MTHRRESEREEKREEKRREEKRRESSLFSPSLQNNNNIRIRIMSWRSHGTTTNDSLIDALEANKLIKSPASVGKAMRKVDRKCYVLERDKSESAYRDHPLGIGANATISAPHMHAMCLELSREYLKDSEDGRGNGRVLDVGSGSGYLVACFAEMLLASSSSKEGAGNVVVGIEHIDSLVERSIKNLTEDGKGEMIKNGSITIVKGDGRLGYEASAPYALIHVGAAAPEVPSALLSQLASPGRLIIPVGGENESQSLMVIDKNEDGEIEYRDEMGVVYVPLTDEEHQLER